MNSRRRQSSRRTTYVLLRVSERSHLEALAGLLALDSPSPSDVVGKRARGGVLAGAAEEAKPRIPEACWFFSCRGVWALGMAGGPAGGWIQWVDATLGRNPLTGA